MKKLFLLIVLLAFASCEQVVDLDLPKGYKRLVVEGGITDQPGPYLVKLTKTRDYSFTYNDTVVFERGAEVIIKDDIGNAEVLKEISPGNYATDSSGIRGEIGRSYSISIITKDGRQYSSRSELLDESPVIESLSYQSINNDRDNGSWDFSVLFKVKNRPGKRDFFLITWYVEDTEKYYYLLSDDFIGNNDMYSEIDGYTFGPHSSKFKLASLSKEGFEFWTEIKKQTEEIGSQFDPPPSPIIGNIENLNDLKDYALGFFNASSVVYSSKIMVTR